MSIESAKRRGEMRRMRNIKCPACGASPWISVRDRLPEDGELILIWGENAIWTGIYKDGRWVDEVRDDWEIECVTHWQKIEGPEE